jgi:hypothetical protein
MLIHGVLPRPFCGCGNLIVLGYWQLRIISFLLVLLEKQLHISTVLRKLNLRRKNEIRHGLVDN